MGRGVHGGAKEHMCPCKMRTHKKNNPHRARKVPRYKCKTNAQIIVAPKAEDSGTVFRSNIWPRPGGEPENRLVAPKGRYTGLHAQSLEGTCGPFLRVGRHVQALGREGIRPLSL
jgi:hypothetical protein